MSSESARVVEITKHAVPSIATEVKFLTLPIQIQPSITIYIVWLDSQKEPFYETVPNEGTTPIRIPLSVDIKRDGGIDEVVRYGFKNKGNSYLLGANLTFNVIFIEAIKHVTKQRDKTTKSLTVPFIPDALGSRAGAGTFLNGVTTTYTPGAMIMSRRETVEINSLPPLSMAWVYFVNRGNTFAKIYFPDIVQNATVDGNNWPSITINKPAQFGELKPAAHHWGNVTVEKP